MYGDFFDRDFSIDFFPVGVGGTGKKSIGISRSTFLPLGLGVGGGKKKSIGISRSIFFLLLGLGVGGRQKNRSGFLDRFFSRWGWAGRDG